MLLQCVCCPTEANKRASTRQPHLIHNIGKTGILESIFAKFTVVSKSCSGFSMTGNTRVTGNENLWGGKKTHLNNDNSNFCRVNLHSASQPRRQINTWKNKKKCSYHLTITTESLEQIKFKDFRSETVSVCDFKKNNLLSRFENSLSFLTHNTVFISLSSTDTVLSLDVFKKGFVFASCAKVSTLQPGKR